MVWTEERVDRLKRLWSEGLSASQIAADLGGVTRNAVIGKVHRLGLSGRVKANAPAPRQRPASTTVQRNVVRHAPAIVRGNTALQTVTMVETVVAAEPQRKPEEVVIPLSRRIAITELREGLCKWPMGDPTQPDFVYCGADAVPGKPYCSAHCRIAYTPSSDRRIRRV